MALRRRVRPRSAAGARTSRPRAFRPMSSRNRASSRCSWTSGRRGAVRASSCTPVLEKVVAAAGGAVKLVKMNIDDHPSIAGQLGIQSIPAVIAFKNGQPVDGFMGAVPESQIRDFIKKLAARRRPVRGRRGACCGQQARDDGRRADRGGDHSTPCCRRRPTTSTPLPGLPTSCSKPATVRRPTRFLPRHLPTRRMSLSSPRVRTKIDLAEQAAALGDRGGIREAARRRSRGTIRRVSISP